MKAVGLYWLLWIGLVVTVVADIMGKDWPGLAYPWAIALALIAPFVSYERLLDKNEALVAEANPCDGNAGVPS